jgi:hypothetical protein
MKKRILSLSLVLLLLCSLLPAAAFADEDIVFHISATGASEIGEYMGTPLYYATATTDAT